MYANRSRYSVAIAVSVLFFSAVNTNSQPSTAPVAVTQTANIAGDWLFVVETRQGVVDASMTVVQSGETINGKLDSAMGVVEFSGTVEGNSVKFSYGLEKFGAPPGTVLSYAGTVENDRMKGKADFAGMGQGEWSATRK